MRSGWWSGGVVSCDAMWFSSSIVLVLAFTIELGANLEWNRNFHGLNISPNPTISIA
jgi:hypothetical protein